MYYNSVEEAALKAMSPFYADWCRDDDSGQNPDDDYDDGRWREYAEFR